MTDGPKKYWNEYHQGRGREGGNNVAGKSTSILQDSKGIGREVFYGIRWKLGTGWLEKSTCLGFSTKKVVLKVIQGVPDYKKSLYGITQNCINSWYMLSGQVSVLETQNGHLCAMCLNLRCFFNLSGFLYLFSIYLPVFVPKKKYQNIFHQI